MKIIFKAALLLGLTATTSCTKENTPRDDAKLTNIETVFYASEEVKMQGDGYMSYVDPSIRKRYAKDDSCTVEKQKLAKYMPALNKEIGVPNFPITWKAHIGKAPHGISYGKGVTGEIAYEKGRYYLLTEGSLNSLRSFYDDSCMQEGVGDTITQEEFDRKFRED